MTLVALGCSTRALDDVLALSSGDVMKEFGKQPKTLGARGVVVCQRPHPVIVYPFRMIQDRKGAYPTLNIFHRNCMGSQITYTKDGAKELMRGHSEMAMAATSNGLPTASVTTVVPGCHPMAARLSGAPGIRKPTRSGSSGV